MGKNRLEAFSDGVLAIIITIMVLELKIPHGDDWASLKTLLPVFLSYIMSFVYVGVYWNNHHHLLHTVHKISGGILWANLHLLFWLSLLPFATGWMGDNHFSPLPTALYGVCLFMAGFAYWLLVKAIIAKEGSHSVLARAIGKDVKGNGSIVVYLFAIPLAFFHPLIAQFLYFLVLIVWLVPDQRIERALAG
jgi:uncharacterized membrane protein